MGRLVGAKELNRCKGMGRERSRGVVASTATLRKRGRKAVMRESGGATVCPCSNRMVRRHDHAVVWWGSGMSKLLQAGVLVQLFVVAAELYCVGTVTLFCCLISLVVDLRSEAVLRWQL